MAYDSELELNHKRQKKKKSAFVDIQLVAGALAWAKINKNLFWPCLVVNISKDCKKVKNESPEVACVQFFGETTSESWEKKIELHTLDPFYGSQSEDCKKGGVHFSNDRKWKDAVEEADKALKFAKDERLKLRKDEREGDMEVEKVTRKKIIKKTSRRKKGDGGLAPKEVSSSSSAPTPLLTSSGDDDRSFPHTSLTFLQSDKIKDANRKSADDPDYDARTLHVPDDFLSKQTPLMRQWWTLKSQYYDAILFFKVGNVYKLFHMDAVIGVDELGLRLMKGDHPHCRFPESWFAKFSNILVQKGHKVGRVEQTETQDQMLERCRNLEHSSKFDKVVRREVCSVQSRGTRKSSFIDGDCHADNNFLLAISEKIESSDQSEPTYGVCFVDVTIGTFYVGQFEDDRHRSRLTTLVSHFPPSQVLYEKGKLSERTRNIFNSYLSKSVKEGLRCGVEFWDSNKTLKVLSESDYFVIDGSFKWPRAFNEMVSREEGLGLVPTENYALGLSALGAVVWYLRHCLMDDEVLSLRSFQIYTPVDVTPGPSKKMVLDGLTLLNLDVLINSSTGTSEGTLLQKLDNCKTPFGKRLIKQWICSPPGIINVINDRLNAMEDIKSKADVISEVSAILSKLPDLERLLNKIHTLGLSKRCKNHPDSRAIFVDDVIYNYRKIKDFTICLEGIHNAKLILEKLKDLVDSFKSNLLKKCITPKDSQGLFPDLTMLLNFFDHLRTSFDKKTGIIIPAEGVNKDYYDALNDIDICKEELAESLEQLKEQLDCKTLTYFGTAKNRYQVEVPESLSRKMSKDYVQTSQRKGFTRYQNQEMQRIFGRLVDAEERRDAAQKDTMRCVFEQFSKHRTLLSEVINCLSVLDVLISLANYSSQSIMSKPEFVPNGNEIFLRIANDCHRDLVRDVNAAEDHPQVLNGVGPMMGVDPKLMRQVALTCILAHLGCYVPAEECRLTPVDKIFARLGASDHIVFGESTSFEELSKTSCMLKHATENSVVVMDVEDKTNYGRFKEFLKKLGSNDHITKEAEILWYAGFVDRIKDRGLAWLRAYFKPSLDDISKEVDDHKESIELLSSLMKRLNEVLDFFTRNETLATVFMDYNQNASYKRSLLGELMRLGPHPGLFPGNHPSNRSTIGKIESEVHEFMDHLRHLIYNFFKKLFQFENDLKRRALTWIGEELKSYMYRDVYIIRITTLSYYEDNLLINLQNILLMFLKPYMNDHSKVVNIQHGYFMATVGSEEERRLRNIHLKGIPDSLLVPLASGQGSSSAPPEDHYEMLTEIFYMAHLTFCLGFSAIHEKLKRLQLQIIKMETCLDHFQQNQEISLGLCLIPQIYGSLGEKLPQFHFYKTLLNHHHLLEKLLQFIALTANFLVHVAMSPHGSSASLINKAMFPLPSNELGRYLCDIPQFLLDNIHTVMTFLDGNKDHYFEGQNQRKHLLRIFEFVLLFMYNPSFVHDTFKKIKLAEILDCFFLTSQPSSYMEGLLSNNIIAFHSMSCVMELFSGMKPASFGYKRSKLKILPTISSIFCHLCEKELHKTAFVELVIDAEHRLDYEDAPVFLRFIYHLTGDAKYFMTEAFKHMAIIRGTHYNDLNLMKYSADVKLAQSYNNTTKSIILIFENMSRIAFHVLSHPIIAEMVDDLLHCYLKHLVGPERVDVKVTNSEEFCFDSNWMLTKICGIFINFWSNNNMLAAFSKLSWKLIPVAIEALIQIEDSKTLIKKMKNISRTLNVLAKAEKEMQDKLERFEAENERFIDQLTYNVMLDPCVCGEHILDRKTIIIRLLHSNQHPYTFTPLTMSMITPANDLKKEIHNALKNIVP